VKDIAMRRRNHLAATAALALSLACAGGMAHAASLLANGDFETGGLSGWTVTTSQDGNVFAATAAIYNPCCGTSGSEPAYSGNHFAAYDSGNVTGSATLSQTFNSVLGGLYTLTFDLGAFGGGTNVVDVTAQGVTQSFGVSANNNADTTFHPQSISFTGLGGVQTIAFTVATVADNTDALLDNAVLSGPSGVPEPAAWALMIVGLGGTGAMLRRRRTLAVA
jgi:hypothetical protein